MKVCFVVPDGVGIRNYLFSDIIKNLHENKVQISIWHKLDNSVISDIQQINKIPIESYKLNIQRESIIGRIFKEAAVFSRIKNNVKIDKNKFTFYEWSYTGKSLKKRFLLIIAEFIGNFLNDYNSILWAEKIYYDRLRKSNDSQLALSWLKKSKPNFLFCTHQRSPEAALVVEAAKELNIPTTSVIYSWDNLPKARLLVKSDNYIVWSDYMKLEFVKYYPEINSEIIHNLGTPQFDFHLNKSRLLSREEIAKEYGLDPLKRWICFSGDDEMSSPFDPYFLRDVADVVSKKNDLELVFRPVPVSGYSRYNKVIDNNNIIVIPPKWKTSELWTYSYPLFEDVNLLSSLAHHCILVINVGSTMALDFASFDKPGLYLNYIPKGCDSKIWNPEIIYGRQHFRTLKNLNAVGWINSKDDIMNYIERVSKNDETVASDRLKWLSLIRKDNGSEGASKQIATFILNRV